MTTITKVTWQNTDRATPTLIDPLLDDMFGLDEQKTPEEQGALLATRDRAKEILTWGEIQMGGLSVMLSSFYEGYLAGFQAQH